MPLRTGVGLSSVTALLELLVESAALTAFTVTELGEGSVFGAVYFPAASMVPRAAEPPAVLLTDQVTEVLVLPVTVAAKVSVAPARMLAVGGVTEIETVSVGGGGFCLEESPEVQPVRTSAMAMSRIMCLIETGRSHICPRLWRP